MRLSAGDTLPALELVGAIGGSASIPPAQGYVHLQLRRFSGCMVCNVHLKQVVQRLPEITAAHVQEVVVFHSTVAEVKRYESELPFVVVADPDKNLYRRFGVERSSTALLAAWRTLPRAVLGAAITAIRTRRLPPLKPVGGELGCPADVLIDSTGRVVAVKYGTHAADQWSVDELLELVDAAGS
ncbi:redoxin domain-containing protein [Salinibacterium sp. G-O1]|uniref:AhpC/TSA family protein n=1 Tax=Salinibacterium sp. G-O1 TaxID=3046208 RepID=UPI0024BA4950|nr:AhpC/TSA family protein [Salinibacterium sp. G-O1]MDJ0336123.1 redoxin domain-containing protein [Salinibacterium sp. G-O1]